MESESSNFAVSATSGFAGHDEALSERSIWYPVTVEPPRSVGAAHAQALPVVAPPGVTLSIFGAPGTSASPVVALTGIGVSCIAP